VVAIAILTWLSLPLNVCHPPFHSDCTLRWSKKVFNSHAHALPFPLLVVSMAAAAHCQLKAVWLAAGHAVADEGIEECIYVTQHICYSLEDNFTSCICKQLPQNKR